MAGVSRCRDSRPCMFGASFVKANAEYFDSVGTRVVMGRGISVQDTSTAPTVAVVNQAFVKQLFKAGENPIGQHFGGRDRSQLEIIEIVGVVEDTAYTDVRWNEPRHVLSADDAAAGERQRSDREG